MKNVISYILVIVLLAPCLLLFNESENYGLNIIGLIYSIILCLAIKYSNDFRRVREFMKSMVERMEY